MARLYRKFIFVGHYNIKVYISIAKMIEVNNLTITFTGKTIINNLSFKIPAQGKATLKGPSGSGKSSLIMALLGFVIPSSGIIKINENILNNSSIKHIRSMTAWAPQELNFDFIYTRELLLLPFGFEANKSSFPSQNNINQTLEKLGLNPVILEKPLKNISGGEKQRISLCSALLQNKPILLLDEPTSALDLETKTKIAKLFSQSDQTIVSASHDDLWCKYNDTIIDITKYNNS